MANLENLDVVAAANRGMMIELLHPQDETVLDDQTEEEEEAIQKILANSKLTQEKREEALSKIRVPKVMFVEVLGSDSDTYRRGAKRNYEKFGGDKKTDIDKLRIAMAELYAKCTISCHVAWGDGFIECNAQALTKLYLSRPFIYELISSKIDDRSALTMD